MNRIKGGAKNSHLLAYNYFSSFTPESKITISAASTTVHNFTQQLRHGKSP